LLRLKIPWPQGREGSTPSSGTTSFSVAWCATGGGRTGADDDGQEEKPDFRRASGGDEAAKADGVIAEA